MFIPDERERINRADTVRYSRLIVSNPGDPVEVLAGAAMYEEWLAEADDAASYKARVQALRSAYCGLLTMDRSDRPLGDAGVMIKHAEAYLPFFLES